MSYSLINTDLCIFEISGDVVNSSSTSTCEETVHIQCSAYQIVIVDVNITSDFSSDILQKCNAHRQCEVTNIQKECVHVEYWCGMGEYDKLDRLYSIQCIVDTLKVSLCWLDNKRTLNLNDFCIVLDYLMLHISHFLGNWFIYITTFLMSRIYFAAESKITLKT